MPQSFFEAGLSAPTVDLCITGNTGSDHMPNIVARVVLPKLTHEFRTLRAWPDEAHLAAQHIPQLRQFVEAGTSQEVSDSCTTGVARYCPYRSEIAFGFFIHRAEFDDCETPPFESDANLSEKDGAAVRLTYDNRDNSEQRREQS